MCGIFGIVMSAESRAATRDLRETTRRLFRLSESRGKEASGIAVLTPDTIRVYKDAVTASNLVRTPTYRELLDKSLGSNGAAEGPLALIGHSRLVTNGVQETNANNQPVITGDSVAVHNGIICNVDRLWERYAALDRQAEIDTEILLRLIEHHIESGRGVVEATQETFKLIEGTASIAVLLRNRDAVLLATNNGSLYTCEDERGQALVFGSEEYILSELLKRPGLARRFSAERIVHCASNQGMLVHLADLRIDRFSLDEAPAEPIPTPAVRSSRAIANLRNGRSNGAVSRTAPARSPDAVVRKTLAEGIASVPELRRCTRCVLPETMPFITFDGDGVCNYCHNWRSIRPAGPEALREAVAPHRRSDARPDSVLAISGGRDSTYALHYVKAELGLNPLAYTYDWGMVTDLARRNVARICGRLGVEHVLVSADINRKRDYIRMNVNAWLRRPDLGTVPLFMAGDKQFFYHANRLQKQLGVKLIIFSMNPLERTEFKTGFCGIHKSGRDEGFWRLSTLNGLRMAFYYGKQYLLNPRYLNASLVDTLGAYGSYYFLPHNYLQFYNYIMWDEDTINRTLIDTYDWELATDTKSTWRIGDGTASFYNYIYYIGAGFTENDTFRSNQIRQGVIDRDTALAQIKTENEPRQASIEWYCDTIGIDCAETIRTINKMPKRYEPRR